MSSRRHRQHRTALAGRPHRFVPSKPFWRAMYGKRKGYVKSQASRMRSVRLIFADGRSDTHWSRCVPAAVVKMCPAIRQRSRRLSCFESAFCPHRLAPGGLPGPVRGSTSSRRTIFGRSLAYPHLFRRRCHSYCQRMLFKEPWPHSGGHRLDRWPRCCHGISPKRSLMTRSPCSLAWSGWKNDEGIVRLLPFRVPETEYASPNCNSAMPRRTTGATLE